MKLIVYDIEVFAFDWLVVFKDHNSGEFTVIHNDNDAVSNFINQEDVYIGFNSKSYDQYIIKGIAGGLTPSELKELNDYLIAGHQGWQHPLLQGNFYRFNNADIRDDVYKGLSLKSIGGHLFLSVEESTVPFDLDRPLTPEELEETVHYCKNDVDTTDKLIEVRKDYLQTKLNLGKRADIPPAAALAMTNAKLTAAMLQAERKEWEDGRDYVYPPNLDISLIPQDVLDFFATIHDKTIPDEVLFKTEFKTVIGGMPCKYAWGGVHGSLLTYHEEATETRAIQNRDVSSLYPSLIEGYNYLSRNVPDPQLFYTIRRERIEAKHRGDKQMAKDLKLPLNTVSGAQENRFNALYDPLPTRSLRISGQLFLTMLAVQLLNACKTIKLLNFNTDGLMYSLDREEIPIADEISAAWEKTTGFELETDNIQKVWIKDVNNLIEIFTDGEHKAVGSYLSYDISVKGAWAINNSSVIVKKALIEYFTKGTPPDDTILACDDITQFQIIAKAGAKYKEAYHEVNGVHEPVQKVNRVYATSDTRYGKLYKVKEENDATAKIESLPEHCVIDNDNHLTIDAVDKTFYIELAQKRINDYLGIKPEKKGRTKKMAATSTKKADTPAPTNVFGKLLAARVQFLESGAKKSGKNMKLTYKYFELDDIVPIATRIFADLHLLPYVSFTNDFATMEIIDIDNPDDRITFTSPMKEIAPIISSRTGEEVTNAIQRLGATQTYQRRYLYMMALDICTPDELDGSMSGDDDSPAPYVAPKAPATTEQREEVKKTLTNAEGGATELQIKALKNALKKLITVKTDDETRAYAAKIAIDTKSFTEISKEVCEQLISQIVDMTAEGENGKAD